MKKIIVIGLLWLLVINVFAIISLNRFNLQPDTAYDWISSGEFQQEQGWSVASLHSRWDSFWYLDIAQNGYSFNGPQQLSNLVFFPLYPLLIRAASFLVGGNFILAGWLLSIVFLLGALVVFFRLVKEFHPEIDPYLPLFLLLVFPTAFFLNAIYTESLFLLLSLLTFYYSFRRNFLKAGIFGLLASLTRVTGLFLFIPIAWEYLREVKFKPRGLLKIKVLPLFLVPLGTLSFFVFHYLRFGDFFLFLKVQSWWGRMFNLNKDHFSFSSNPAIVNFALDAMCVVFIFTVIYFVFRRLRVSYGLYMLATVLVALSTGTLMSIGRYILVLFPLYILGASIKSLSIRYSWVFVSVLLLAMNIILFVNNYWAG